ncbi:ABC transporter permease [Solimicrobium silvestre]|uniref:FtsX-like permease family n=1 Tax=Solimicrobium silvestre TaxID=2099400 RepID=A0A2S9H4P8_9BURK|nr:ABC transporter permease [Solimicrobium silvestre]PRC94952.1 FtsX-like permease family [Solimicrobium silvestre]
MNLRDFRIGWRLLINEPAYSMVVIFGLTLGFAVCFLLLGFVRYSFSYDSQVPDNENVYVLQHKVNIMPVPQWMEFMPMPVRSVALNSGMVSSVSAAIPISVTIKVGNHMVKDELMAVDPSFQTMWGVMPLEGDLHAALTRPDAIALTVSLAQKIFGEMHVLGKTLDIKGKQFQVVALLPEAQLNTTLPYTALVGLNTQAMTDEGRSGMLSQWQRVTGKVYLKLAAGITPAQMTEILQNAFDHSPWTEFPPEMLKRLGHNKIFDVRLVSLQNAYFDMDVANNLRSGPRASKLGVLALAGVALLILILASTNFVNLATVRTLRRKREIAVRKILGAKAGRVVSQFFAEAILVSLTATCLGLLLAWLLLPLFSDLVNRHLGNLFTPAYCLISLSIGVLIGLVSGLYPTWVALKVHPALVLSGRSNSNSIGSLLIQRGLTALQFSIAMMLSAIAVAIAWQTSFATHRDPGFDTSNLITITMPDDAGHENIVSFREQLLHLPDVQGVTATEKAVGEQGIGSSTDYKSADGKSVSAVVAYVGANFFDVYGLKPVFGRLFNSAIEFDENAGVVVINSVAARAFGFATPEAAIGQIIQGTFAGMKPLKIIGIAPDIRHQNLREVIQPLVYLPNNEDLLTLTVRTSGDVSRLESAIENIWQKKFPPYALQMRRVKNVFIEIYAEDLGLAKMIGIASLVAIGLALFGVYALSANNLQRRHREIILRKLYGATSQKIAKLVARDFIGLVALGAIVGLPIAGVVIARYMSSFVERAPLGIWPLVAAFGLALIIALIATLRHTLIAIRMKPAQALSN